MNDWDLWKGQQRILEDTHRPELAAIAGFGYGKSLLGARWHFTRVLINDASPLSLVTAPDYKLAKQVDLETYIQTLEALNLKEDKHFRINIADLTVVHLWGVKHKTVFLSAEKPRKIMAYTASHAWADEAARYQHEAVVNLVGRIRCPKAKALQTLYTFTPEGENFMYEKFSPDNLTRVGKHSENERQLVLHGSSYDNPTLPQSFFDNLKETFGWDEAYFANYVMGEFYSLSRNRFYYSFSQKENVRAVQIDPQNKTLILSFDFNVGQMSWSAIQKQYSSESTKPIYAVIKSNRSNARNIQEACQQFLDTFPPEQFKSFRISVLGDATGHNRSEQTYTTGYQVISTCLKPHFPALTIDAPRGNPFVAERSFVTNRLFAQGRLIIDPSCTKVIESAKMVETDGKGGIKKTSGDTITHAMEAVDMALMVLEPPEVLHERKGFNY